MSMLRMLYTWHDAADHRPLMNIVYRLFFDGKAAEFKRRVPGLVIDLHLTQYQKIWNAPITYLNNLGLQVGSEVVYTYAALSEAKRKEEPPQPRQL